MALGYARVMRHTWNGETFLRASDDARLAAMYLLTNRHGNTEGLYRLPVAFASYELRWDEDRVGQAFDELVDLGFLEYDADADLVLIVNALRYQAPTGAASVKGAANTVAGIPASYVRSRFVQLADEHCPELGKLLREGHKWTPEPPPKRSQEGPPRDPRRSRKGPSGNPVGVAGGSPEPSTPSPTHTQAQTPLAPTPSTRKRDALWDTLWDELGVDPNELTPSAKGAANKALAELRGVGATPDEIRCRCAEYRRRFKDRVELSPSALAKHWAALGSKRTDGLEDDVALSRGLGISYDDQTPPSNVRAIGGSR